MPSKRRPADREVRRAFSRRHSVGRRLSDDAGLSWVSIASHTDLLSRPLPRHLRFVTSPSLEPAACVAEHGIELPLQRPASRARLRIGARSAAAP